MSFKTLRILDFIKRGRTCSKLSSLKLLHGLDVLSFTWRWLSNEYLTIIPRARMGSESIAHEGERNNCFSKIQQVGQKNIETKQLSLVKARL